MKDGLLDEQKRVFEAREITYGDKYIKENEFMGRGRVDGPLEYKSRVF